MYDFDIGSFIVEMSGLGGNSPGPFNNPGNGGFNNGNQPPHFNNNNTLTTLGNNNNNDRSDLEDLFSNDFGITILDEYTNTLCDKFTENYLVGTQTELLTYDIDVIARDVPYFKHYFILKQRELPHLSLS
ncbi:hypothetical protein ASPZODRAFT_147944 [Penicilliopsis zonata CBS 506.65]|uniref:Uncharacterized protein n=1 Tax=Penicilliopsis zonata CBS 506.65 TaxID=1073090 RepID=A0A1L9S4C6_9EURO|nr:hypothetical protein ASPZODRAFT_147944 [Penicilliopsis zonata CBS 506.65]OJJ41983.1 hypothetical protein ASPZODRAFT_147944 [Penicilliopsis zonata CBS 506.65]